MGEGCGLSALQRDYKLAAMLTSSYWIGRRPAGSP